MATRESVPQYIEEDRGYGTSCWIWRRATNYKGYGQVRRDDDRSKQTMAHRLFWQRANGPIPEGMEIHHLCRVRACVNPEHLSVVTHAENMLHAQRNLPRKVSRTQVDAIRDLWGTGRWTQTNIAEVFGISSVQVGRIVRHEQRGSSR